jgi:hypothetical protein
MSASLHADSLETKFFSVEPHQNLRRQGKRLGLNMVEWGFEENLLFCR